MTRTTGSSVDTYSYLGSSDTVVRIANTGGTGAVTDSISDPAGDRPGTKTGSTVAWLTPTSTARSPPAWPRPPPR